MKDPRNFADSYQPDFGIDWIPPIPPEDLKRMNHDQLVKYATARKYAELRADENPVGSGWVLPSWRMVMEAWKKELGNLKQNPKIATLKVTRNERDRQFSTFHRFGIDPEFDCSFPRPPSSFATASKAYADVEIQNENCWADAPGAEKCLRDALQLVNLSAESKGFLQAATEVIIGQSTNTKQEIATESCSTSPAAT